MTVSHTSGGRVAAPGGPRDASGCELSPGPAPREKGAVELASDGGAAYQWTRGGNRQTKRHEGEPFYSRSHGEGMGRLGIGAQRLAQ
jgi:hypothetical protein